MGKHSAIDSEPYFYELSVEQLTAKIESLEALIEALKARVTVLEAFNHPIGQQPCPYIEPMHPPFWDTTTVTCETKS